MSRIPLLPDRGRPLLFAHRGCSSLVPENTPASFRKARETGAPGLELDIHLCASGELVVAHDDTFRRTAPQTVSAPGEERTIESMRWEEISGIDVGSFFDPRFSAERCPLLQNVLEEFCPALYVDIELKTRKTSGDDLPAAAAKLLGAMGPKIAGAVTISSFNPFALGAFKKAAALFPPAAGIPCGIIYCVDREVPWILRRGAGRFLSGCDYAKPKYDQVNTFTVFCIDRIEGRPLVPWTIDDPGIAAKMLGLGCEGIITNCPQYFSGPKSAVRNA